MVEWPGDGGSTPCEETGEGVHRRGFWDLWICVFDYVASSRKRSVLSADGGCWPDVVVEEEIAPRDDFPRKASAQPRVDLL